MEQYKVVSKIIKTTVSQYKYKYIVQYIYILYIVHTQYNVNVLQCIFND